MHEIKYYTSYTDIFRNVWQIRITAKGLLLWTPMSWNFGTNEIPTQKTFILINLSEDDAIVDISIIGDQFEIVNLYDLTDIVIPGGESIEVIVEFDGHIPGAYVGTLRATSLGINYDVELVGLWTTTEIYGS